MESTLARWPRSSLSARCVPGGVPPRCSPRRCSVDILLVFGLVCLGIAVGTYGALIGSGGGFLLTPVLLLIYPSFAPETVTAMSLGVATATGLSGGLAYRHQKRIDYSAGALFSVATIPAGALGALATGLFPRDLFEIAVGGLLAAVAIWLILPSPSRLVTSPPPGRYLRRLLKDANGDTYSYAFDPLLALLVGFGLGFIAALFGFGGGIFYVPVMVLVMRFPAHIAVATSTFVLIFTAGSGSLVHLISGHYGGVGGQEMALLIGVFGGAQIGALVSGRLVGRQELVARLLSGALGFVGLRLLLGSLL